MILSPTSPYPHERTFVLRLHRDAAPADGRLVGQLEHLPSGRRYSFATADELIACIAAARRHDTQPLDR